MCCGLGGVTSPMNSLSLGYEVIVVCIVRGMVAVGLFFTFALVSVGDVYCTSIGLGGVIGMVGGVLLEVVSEMWLLFVEGDCYI